MPRKSERRRGFGVLLGDIRDSLGDTQTEFAERIGVSRPVIGNVETGTPPSDVLITLLTNLASERKEEIHAEAKRYRKPRTRRAQARRPPVIKERIDALLGSNELHQARDMLRHWVGTGESNDDTIWAVETLAQIEEDLGDRQASRQMFQCAIDLYTIRDGRYGSLWERYALSCYADEGAESALKILETGIRRHPTGASLWYRKGLLHWEQEELPNAYAAFTTALTHKGGRLDILWARALVLLDWNAPAHAVRDLEDVAQGHNTPPMRVVQALSALAYTRLLARLTSTRGTTRTVEEVEGVFTQAEDELHHAEELLPDNPWPHYFRAMCHYNVYFSGMAILHVVHTGVRFGGPEPTSEVYKEMQYLRLTIYRELDRALASKNPPIDQLWMTRIKDLLIEIKIDERVCRLQGG